MLGSCLKQSEGSTATEYAILLALLVSGAFLVVQGLGYIARQPFETLTLTETPAPGPLQNHLPTTFQVRLEPEQETRLWSLDSLSLVERSAMLLVLALCVYLLQRQKPVSQNKPSPDSPKAESAEQHQAFIKRQKIYHVLATNLDSLFNSHVQVRHLMSNRVTTVRPHTTLQQMKQMMEETEPAAFTPVAEPAELTLV